MKSVLDFMQFMFTHVYKFKHTMYWLLKYSSLLEEKGKRINSIEHLWNIHNHQNCVQEIKGKHWKENVNLCPLSPNSAAVTESVLFFSLTYETQHFI